MKVLHRFLGFVSVILLFVTGCSTEPTPDFFVSLRLTNQELSEDSNFITETLLIESYEGVYTWSYEGYHPGDNFENEKEFDFKLNDEQMHDLTLLIRENGLMVSREDTVSTGEPWSAFELTWDMSMGGQSASGHVKGEPITWEEWNVTKNDSVVSDESLFAAEHVMDYVQAFWAPRTFLD